MRRMSEGSWKTEPVHGDGGGASYSHATRNQYMLMGNKSKMDEVSERLIKKRRGIFSLCTHQ